MIFRYPPLEVVHEETFDAREAVRQVLEQHPEALVAVEERGVGYRVNRPFPDGELSGEMIETDLDEIVGGPVSRVIIRDPNASADDFVSMAAKLGLQGTDYVVGWTAWLDLAPVGVSKASGLEHVAEELGLDPRGRPRHRRRAQRHRDAAVGGARGGDGPGGAGGPRRRRRRHRHGVRRRRGRRAAPLVSREPAPRSWSPPARLRLPLVTPEDAAGMLAGRRRVSWHRDYPRKDDQDAAAMVKADDPDASWGPRHIVRSSDGLVVGSIGFFGAPAAGPDEVPEAEVGFGLVRGGPRARRGERGAGSPARGDRPGRRTHPGERASREPGQPAGAGGLRLHRAARLDRGRRAGDGSAALGNRLRDATYSQCTCPHFRPSGRARPACA